METRSKATCLLSLLLATQVQAGCRHDNWYSSFDNRDGLSKCSNVGNEYLRGFFRNSQRSPDVISLLEEGICCTPPSPYYGDETQVFYANWWRSFDHNNRWNVCPPGTFLQGLFRTGGGNRLWNIEEGRCMKPASHPYTYGQCYDHNTYRSFDNRGTSQCNENYFTTGLYRGGCDQLYCIEKIRCCKMASSAHTVNSLDAAKTKVMDNTMSDMALLGHYLGYGWCGGCRGPYVGEDFYRDGNKWVSSTRGPCSGYMSDQRLSMDYGDWKFSLEDVVFGEPIIQELVPESVDTGVVVNNFDYDVSHVVTRSHSVTRTVHHTVTSEWRRSHDLGITVGYTPGWMGGVSASATYNFNYETSSSTSDSTGQEQTRTMSVEEGVTVPGHQNVNWTLILSKTRRTVPYTAKILIHFSTEFRGFLRWGGGPGGASTNFHHDHTGSGDRPTIHYRFGGSRVPFYEDLKTKSDTFQYPWLWVDLKARYGSAQNLINSLASEGRYEFTLTGKFDDVSGKDIRIEWGQPLTRRRRDATQVHLAEADGAVPTVQHLDAKIKNTVATEKPGDPPSVFPPPPNVELDPVVKYEKPHDVPPMMGD